MLKKNIIKISFHLFFFFFLIFYNINNIEASYCEYNSNVYSNEDGKMEGIDIKFRVDFDEDSFSWKWSNYDGSITKDNERNFYPTGGGTLWQKSFSEETFRNYVDEYGQCPNFIGYTNDSFISVTLTISDGANDANVYLYDYEMDNSEEEPQTIAECSYTYAEDFGEDYLNVKFYVTNKGKQMMSLKSANINATNVEVFSESGASKVIRVNGNNVTIVVPKEEVSNIFSYSDSSDLSTLKCGTVYLNVIDTSSRTYELSSESGAYADSGDDDLDRILSSDTYKNLLGQLKPPLSELSSRALSIPLVVDDNEITLNEITANDNLCSGDDCTENAQYLTQEGLKEIRSYCNNIYSIYAKNQYKNIDKRMDECISFNDFYQELVKQNIINDLSIDCNILSEGLIDILRDFLNIIKIAGPLLALGLGTLDFVRTVASGDADKEMKNTFKRFSIRLIAAALLFLVPFILAFLMDLFLGNQDGYNSDNPFCSIVDWGE